MTAIPKKVDASVWFGLGGTTSGLLEAVDAAEERQGNAIAPAQSQQTNSSFASLRTGSRVKATDGGRENIGHVVEDHGPTATVHFVSPDGVEKDVEISKVFLSLMDGTSAAATPFAIRTISSRELARGDFRVIYLVAGILAALQQMVIAAPLKSMKTSLAVALAVALASGRPFLGIFQVLRPVNVLVCSGESGLGPIKDTAIRIAASQGDELEHLDRLFWSTDIPKLGDSSHLVAIHEAIVSNLIEVLIIDPLYFALPGADANNLMIIGELLRGVSQICDETKTTLIFVHHVKKSVENPNAPPELSDISWAGTAEWARQWILLSRRRRYEPGTGRHELWMSVGGSAGHNGLHALNIVEGVGTERTWDVQLAEPDAARKAATEAKQLATSDRKADQLASDMAAILEAVVKLPSHRGTKTEIKDRTGRNGQAFSAAFAQLVRDGHLLSCEVQKNNRRYDGFELNNESENDSFEPTGRNRTEPDGVEEQNSVRVTASRNGTVPL